MSSPALRLLSLGAGVQSTAALILSARGDLPPLDGAIFSDTGWEPAAVYEHLNRLEREVADPAGIPIYRVSAGNIRNDALDPERRAGTMPLHVLNPNGSLGMTRRQCTKTYKQEPIRRQVRAMLGFPHPTRVPKGTYAEQWIGISTDERDRALDESGEFKSSGVKYATHRYPLLELGLSRDACALVNARAGFPDTPKSACIGCPFHSNMQWRNLRDNSPAEFADAVAFDESIRAGLARAKANGKPLLGQAFLHRSRVPLAEAPIDRATFREWASRQGDLLHEVAMAEFDEALELADQPGGCSPYGCRA